MTTPARSPRYQALVATLAFATAAILLSTSVVSLYVAVETRDDLKQDIQEIHVLINSRMDELLVEARKSARAEGIIEGEGR